MSFLVPLGLLVGLFVALPIIAHSLFRGPARPLVFPGAHLVPRSAATAQKQSRIEDRGLLGLRILLLLTLALLAASPFVQCSRLSLSRPGGSSLGIALVIDDSGSMNALVDGKSRFERAVEGAEQILSSARSGDAFSIVLAGRPARVALPATSDLASVKRSLESLQPSERSTDLTGALVLAQATLESLPQPTRQRLVFSDFAGGAAPSLPADAGKNGAKSGAPALEADVRAPLARLREPVENCALGRAERSRGEVTVELGCTSSASLDGRKIELFRLPVDAPSDEEGQSIAEQPAVEGLVRFELKDDGANTEPTRLVARLSESERDRLTRDDRSDVLESEDAPRIGVRADPETAGTQTGTTTVFELALRALGPELRVEPMTLLPDSSEGLSRFSALLVDDPPGFSPETREALEKWLEGGGVALFLLGPATNSAPLGAGFWPLTKGAPRFGPTESSGAAPGAGATLGEAWNTWSDLEPTGRVTFDPAPGSTTLLSWTDGAPLLVERPLGRGVAYVVTLPASVDQSDLALRPAFLAAIDRLLDEANHRQGRRSAPLGVEFVVPEGSRVVGPRGPVAAQKNKDGALSIDPADDGRYVVEAGGVRWVRHAARELEESLGEPREPQLVAGAGVTNQEAQPLPISREIALVALVLGALELGFRAFRRRKDGSDWSGSPEPASSPISPS